MKVLVRGDDILCVTLYLQSLHSKTNMCNEKPQKCRWFLATMKFRRREKLNSWKQKKSQCNNRTESIFFLSLPLSPQDFYRKRGLLSGLDQTGGEKSNISMEDKNISVWPWEWKVNPVMNRGLCLGREVKKAILFLLSEYKTTTVLRKCQSVYCKNKRTHYN